jgi:hypothetical protein
VRGAKCSKKLYKEAIDFKGKEQGGILYHLPSKMGEEPKKTERRE